MPKPPVHSGDPHRPDLTVSPEAARQPDYSSLPGLVWIAVLQTLAVRDRYRLSLTCRKLHSLFSHPTIWRSAVLNLPMEKSFDQDDMSRCRGLVRPGQKKMVEKFGQFFQVVTLCLEAFELHPECCEFLQRLAEGSSLKVCVIQISDVPDGQVFHQLSQKKGPSVYDLLQDLSPRLQGNLHLDITTSGINADLYDDIFRRPCSDLRCTHLRSLMIPFSDYTEQQIVERLSLETQTPSAGVVSWFPVLQHLSLSHHHFSDSLLYALSDSAARHCQLRTLHADFAACDIEEDDDVSEVTSEAWSHLTSFCPGLEVSCYFQRPAHLDKIMKPETPLVSIEVDSMAEKVICPFKFLSFCVDHSETLRSLHFKVDEDIDIRDDLYPDHMPIVSIAAACPKLTRLHYGAIILSADVVRLAQLGRRWESLAINANYVLRDDQAVWDDSLAVMEDAAMLEHLRQTVSHTLGHSWNFHYSRMQD